MVFNKTLTATEVHQLYLGGKYGGDRMNSSQTAKGENWTLGVRAGDFTGFSDEKNSSNVIILNSKPSLSDVFINTTNNSANVLNGLTLKDNFC